MKRTDEEVLEKAYVDGYRRIPDATDGDFEAIERTAISDLRHLKD